ncbi:MAG TPA: EAL domain-containing protein [Xanthomonadales bacterium]|nr:EAL domain-containing protein [Xanthomonadales bacterium]
MGKQDNVIRLLLIEDSVEDAEQIISVLRNGGIAVRPVRAENADHLALQLKTQSFDVVVINPASKTVSIAGAAEAIAKSGKDLPLITLIGTATDDTILNPYRDGATAVAIRGKPEHVMRVVRREFDNLATRRNVRRLEASLRESERRCEALLDSSRDPICFVHEGMHVRANKAYLDMFGFEDSEEIEGTPLLDMIAPEHAPGFKELLKKLSKGEKPPVKLELKGQKSDGTQFDAVMEFAEATYEGEPCQQITFRQNLGGAVADADTDIVTGLHTRSRLLKELDHVVTEAAEGRTDLALLMLEPDNFKSLLDTIGIGNADLLLADMAGVLREFGEEADQIGRLSDTTFAILLKRSAHDEAAARAERIRKRFEDKLFDLSNKSLSLTTSIAVVMIGEKIANADAILGQATNKLKAAQAAGGNRIEIFDPAAQDKADAEAERTRLDEIRHALKNNGFLLFYQPIISLHGAEGEFYEILVRMHGKAGEILPAGFFPIAERNNLLPAIDRWVVASAIRSLGERERAGHRTTFFVKLSAQSLDDPTLLPWIAEHLKQNRVRGDALVFEMPESKVLTNMKPVRAFVKGLAQLHCAFALEQFGSGLNSFQLLKHVDATYLKLDRTYMTDLPKNKENQQRIKELCEQAHQLGKLTVAEFVEDAASMSVLFTFGVNFVQGNFLQEPEKIMSYEFAGA